MPFPLRRVLDPITEPISLCDMKNYLRVDIDDDDDLIGTLISTARERAEDLTARCLLRQQWTFAMDKFPSWYGHDSGATWFGYHRHPRHHSMFRDDSLAIILPRGPVLSVDSIIWRDLKGVINTLDPNLYETDLVSEPARIRPLYNGHWPFAVFDTNSVVITFTAGHEQTVTETLTLPAEAPFVLAVSRQLKALSLTSVVDASTLSNPVPTQVAATMTDGIITFTGGVASQTVQSVYQVNSIPLSIIHAIKLMGSAWYENRAEVVQGGGNFNSMPTPMSASSLLGTYELFKLGYPKS